MSDVTVVKVVPMLLRKKLLRGALTKSGRFLSNWTPRFASRHFRDADFFVSVGGDIYTVFDGDLPMDWIGYETYATKLGIPSVMLGANMENFGVLGQEKLDTLLSHLKRFRLIAVRDQRTAEYLATYFIRDNVVVLPDPVFALRPKAVFRPKKLERIGVNLSGLAAESDQEIVAEYVALVETLLSAGRKVLLVPHVYSPQGAGTMEDSAMLRTVASMVREDLRRHLSLYEGEITFEKISEVIGSVDALVGARMHACLNALTQGKPTLFLAYSGKASSMTDWLRSTPYGAVSPCFAVKELASAGDPFDIVSFLDAAEEFLERSGSVSVDLSELVQSAAERIAGSLR